MPIKLSTTLSKISYVPNSTNASLLDELYAFMRTTGASESHCNNTLETATAKSYSKLSPFKILFYLAFPVHILIF
ncbi:MAG: hypothetical protein WBL44_11785 [Nitrososphaeraceae archaeon]